MEHKSRTQAEHRARAEHILRSAGGKMTPAKAVHAHEAHLHKGATPTKLAKGGKVKGPTHVTVNVVHGDEQRAQQQGMQQGMQAGRMMGAQMAAQKMAGAPPGMPPGGPPRPPMGPPPGAAPGGMPPGGMRPSGMATGGGVKAPHLAGAAGGNGRLQKTLKYGAKTGGGTPMVKVREHFRRGGKVKDC